MNVVRLVNHFPSPEKISYGLEPTLYHLSKEQVKLGMNVHVICKRYPHQRRFENIEDIHVHRVPRPYNFSALYQLDKISKDIKIDVVHAHATSCPSYAIFKRSLKFITKAVYVVHVHGTTKGILSAWSKITSNILNEETVSQRVRRYLSIMRETTMWKSADALIANSNFLREELVNLYGIPRKKIYVVYNGVDLQMFYPRKSRETILKALGLDLRSRTILYLGGLRPIKGPAYIVEALEKIHNKIEDVKVIFVGGKHPLDRYYDKAVMKLVKNLREKGVICVIENIPHVQLPDYYSAVDIVVVPSIYDSFPKVILEAMACGTPVIASAVGGIPELISHGNTGILVESANPDGLAEAIISIVLNTDLRKKLGSRARSLVEKHFAWEHAANRMLTVYKKLLKLD